MKRRSIPFLALTLLMAACSSGSEAAVTSTTEDVSQPTTTSTTLATTTTTKADSFPATVQVGGVEVTLDHQPIRIVSLSATATETLFAIGAGSQVVAVDEYSDYPDEAPTTDLSGFTPNIEAIASFDPDLIVVAFDPEDIINSAFGPNVPVVVHYPAVSREDLLEQIEQLGVLSGHLDSALTLTADIEARWDEATKANAQGSSVYIEIDATFYSSSSNSFMGGALVDMGYTNIADPADEDGFGFPQLSAEAIIAASPDVIIVGTDAGIPPEEVAARPGWNAISAVVSDRVIQIDSDISSRWGPRFIDYIETMADLASQIVQVAD